mgnify:CR=1 FL=1
MEYVSEKRIVEDLEHLRRKTFLVFKVSVAIGVPFYLLFALGPLHPDNLSGVAEIITSVLILAFSIGIFFLAFYLVRFQQNIKSRFFSYLGIMFKDTRELEEYELPYHFLESPLKDFRKAKNIRCLHSFRDQLDFYFFSGILEREEKMMREQIRRQRMELDTYALVIQSKHFDFEASILDTDQLWSEDTGLTSIDPAIIKKLQDFSSKFTGCQFGYYFSGQKIFILIEPPFDQVKYPPLWKPIESIDDLGVITFLIEQAHYLADALEEPLKQSENRHNS